jgi:hypothetical protein
MTDRIRWYHGAPEPNDHHGNKTSAQDGASGSVV